MLNHNSIFTQGLWKDFDLKVLSLKLKPSLALVLGDNSVLADIHFLYTSSGVLRDKKNSSNRQMKSLL